MGAGCISAVWPFLFLSATAYLPLLGERSLHTWLLTGAWHLPPFVGLSFCCLTWCFAGGEILNKCFQMIFFFFTAQAYLVTEFYLPSHFK